MEKDNQLSKTIQFYKRLKNISFSLIIYTVLSFIYLFFGQTYTTASICIAQPYSIDRDNKCLIVVTQNEPETISQVSILHRTYAGCHNLTTINNGKQKIKTASRDLQFKLTDGDLTLFGKEFSVGSVHEGKNYFTLNPWTMNTVNAENLGQYHICGREEEGKTTLIEVYSDFFVNADGKGLIIFLTFIGIWGYAKYKFLEYKNSKIEQSLKEILDNKTFQKILFFKNLKYISAALIVLFFLSNFLTIIYQLRYFGEPSEGCPVWTGVDSEKQCLESLYYEQEGIVTSPLAAFYFVETDIWGRGDGCALYEMNSEIFTLPTTINKLNFELLDGELYLNSNPFPTGSTYNKTNYFYWHPSVIEKVNFENIGSFPLCDQEDESEVIFIKGNNSTILFPTKGNFLILVCFAIWIFSRYQYKNISSIGMSQVLMRRVQK